MSARPLFAIFGAIVAIMWIIALATMPGDDSEGRTVISWSTDPNPARPAQIVPFHEKHPDILVKVEPNTFDRTIVQASTGVGPDLIEIYDQAQMVTLAEAGVLLDLTPYAERFGISPEVTYPKLRGNLLYNGKQYRFPANVSCGVLFYNKRVFEEAGIPPPPPEGMTWQEYIELVKPLTVRRADGRGFERFAMALSQSDLEHFHLQHGARIFSEDGTRCILDSPESIAAMQFYLDLMHKHQLAPSPDAAAAISGDGGWGVNQMHWFATGRAASMIGGRWMIILLRQYPEMEGNLGVALVPHMPGGVPATYCGARGPGINALSKNIEESLLFLQYLASDDYSRIIAMSSDALPPNRHYVEDPNNLLNPEYPWEDFQEVFVRAMDYAESKETSPFVESSYVSRVWIEAIEAAENRLITAEEAMRTVTRRVNERIRLNLRDQPELRKLYEERTGTTVATASGNSMGR
jgi:multiple sugar transport system substrate-binding protein